MNGQDTKPPHLNMKPKYFKKNTKTLLQALESVDWDRLIETCDNLNRKFDELLIIYNPRTKVQTIAPAVHNPTLNEN